MSPAYGTAGRVLVVEDEVGARHGLQVALRALGHDVTTVFIAEEAVAPPETPTVRLLPTDLVLPGTQGTKPAASAGIAGGICRWS